MTDIREIWKVCEEEGICVDLIECRACESFSLMIGERCYIAIDRRLPELLMKERAAHEVGHCVKGAFYNRDSPHDIISQHEYRADKWAIEKLIPREELVEQIKKNRDSLYLLAEYFGVSEQFIKKACVHYGLYHDAC
ncbi:MAG: ImmA/IrrE family metallo-endopeptidase [Ruminococcus sp.]|nr:ImmA/IrrE family metallo-endopeptidase [Ruminococcus sp.]